LKFIQIKGASPSEFALLKERPSEAAKKSLKTLNLKIENSIILDDRINVWEKEDQYNVIQSLFFDIKRDRERERININKTRQDKMEDLENSLPLQTKQKDIIIENKDNSIDGYI